MASRNHDAAGDLHSMKAILRVLRDRGCPVARSTVYAWRHTLPPSQRPPISNHLDGHGHSRVLARKVEILAWVDRMQGKGLFEQARKNHATRALKKVSQVLAP